MGIVGQVAAWILVAFLLLYVFVSEFLDMIGRLEMIEAKWPKVWGFLSNRPMRLVLIFFLLVIVGNDLVERMNEKVPALVVKMPSIPAPVVTFAQGAQSERPVKVAGGLSPVPTHPPGRMNQNLLDTPLLHAVQEDLTSNDTNFLYEKKVTINAKETTSPFNLVLTFDPSFYASGSPFTCTVSGVSGAWATAGARSATKYSYSVQSPPVGPENPVICHFWSKVPFQLVKADLDR